jgi:translation initiation factor 2 alpha subunit (eIF-2alpha)
VYDKQEKSKKTITTTDAKNEKTVTEEETTATRTKKVTLKCFGSTAEEDIESFFVVFERFGTELETEWNESMSNYAQILFDGMDKMLIETANSEWHDVLGNQTRRDWETFKKTVAMYITTKQMMPMLSKLHICKRG